MNRALFTALIALATTASVASATDNYITGFTKTDNIYTNINMQFPTTGTGTPGSGVGTPNASFLFDPSPAAVAAAGYAPNYLPASNLVNNGVTFNLTSDTAGHDFSEINAGATLTTPTAIANASAVYLIAGAYFTTSDTITFTGLDGHTESFPSIFLPDFNGGTVNSTGTSPTPWFDQTLFQVQDVGAGGSGNSATGDTNNYDITELGFTLDSTLANEPLTSVSVTTNSGGTTLLYAITATTAAPEPASLSLLALATLPLLRRRR
jgi:MYXO-CTERM domain-containing protein